MEDFDLPNDVTHIKTLSIFGQNTNTRSLMQCVEDINVSTPTCFDGD